MASRFEIRKNKTRISKKKFWVATIGDNNEILQSSQKLYNKEDCYKNIEAVQGTSKRGVIIDTTVIGDT